MRTVLATRESVADSSCRGYELNHEQGTTMMLFQRQMRVTGGAAAAAWAAEVTAGVNKHSVSPISLWMGRFGAPVGTIAWSTPVEALGQLDDLNAAMAADSDLAALVARGADHVAEADPDRLMAIVHGEITDVAALGSYVGAVRAQAAPGKWAAAGAWAAHIAGVYSEVTGLNVVVTSTVAGPMGEITWLVRHENASSIETAIGATMASEKYLSEVDGAGELFQPGASQMYAQRLA